MATDPQPRTGRELDVVFAALADPTRRAILARLSRGEASVGDLAKPFDNVNVRKAVAMAAFP